MTSLDVLPNEMLDSVFPYTNSQKDLVAICLTSTRFNGLATKTLYNKFEARQNDTWKIRSVLRTIIKRPELASQVKSAIFGNMDIHIYGVNSEHPVATWPFDPTTIVEGARDVLLFTQAAGGARVPELDNAVNSERETRARVEALETETAPTYTCLRYRDRARSWFSALQEGRRDAMIAFFLSLTLNLGELLLDVVEGPKDVFSAATAEAALDMYASPRQKFQRLRKVTIRGFVASSDGRFYASRTYPRMSYLFLPSVEELNGYTVLPFGNVTPNYHNALENRVFRTGCSLTKLELIQARCSTTDIVAMLEACQSLRSFRLCQILSDYRNKIDFSRIGQGLRLSSHTLETLVIGGFEGFCYADGFTWTGYRGIGTLGSLHGFEVLKHVGVQVHRCETGFDDSDPSVAAETWIELLPSPLETLDLLDSYYPNVRLNRGLMKSLRESVHELPRLRRVRLISEGNECLWKDEEDRMKKVTAMFGGKEYLTSESERALYEEQGVELGWIDNCRMDSVHADGEGSSS